MKFIVSSSNLLKNLQAISGVLSSNNTLPILDNFLFELSETSLHISASDLETTMTVAIALNNAEEPGSIAVPAKFLLDILKTFPENKALARWIENAQKKVHFQGLPARICWLGYGERAKMGKIFNDLVAEKKVSAPIVIGRDHLDCGSVASPNRETEGMKDGSDAIADWPILNALLNACGGASWVSVHHGGGVGIGKSIHAGMVVVADGTKEAEERLIRVLTYDPGMGIMRHADAGYDQAIKNAKTMGIKIPMIR